MLGLTGLSWNGIYLAEVAAIAPPGAATGGARSMTFLGIVLASARSYTLGFAIVAAGAFSVGLRVCGVGRPASLRST